jgi:hypothetical protein
VRSVGYRRNPTNPVFAESETREVEAAARSLSIKVVSFNTSDSGGIEQAFRAIVQQRMDALFVSADAMGFCASTLMFGSSGPRGCGRRARKPETTRRRSPSPYSAPAATWPKNACQRSSVTCRPLARRVTR